MFTFNAFRSSIFILRPSTLPMFITSSTSGSSGGYYLFAESRAAMVVPSYQGLTATKHMPNIPVNIKRHIALVHVPCKESTALQHYLIPSMTTDKT